MTRAGGRRADPARRHKCAGVAVRRGVAAQRRGERRHHFGAQSSFPHRPISLISRIVLILLLPSLEARSAALTLRGADEEGIERMPSGHKASRARTKFPRSADAHHPNLPCFPYFPHFLIPLNPTTFQIRRRRGRSGGRCTAPRRPAITFHSWRSSEKNGLASTLNPTP